MPAPVLAHLSFHEPLPGTGLVRKPAGSQLRNSPRSSCRLHRSGACARGGAGASSCAAGTLGNEPGPAAQGSGGRPLLPLVPNSKCWGAEGPRGLRPGRCLSVSAAAQRGLCGLITKSEQPRAETGLRAPGTDAPVWVLCFPSSSEMSWRRSIYFYSGFVCTSLPVSMPNIILTFGP